MKFFKTGRVLARPWLDLVLALVIIGRAVTKKRPQNAPVGLQRGNDFIYHPLKWFAFSLGFLLKGKHTLVGAENLEQAVALHQRGKRIVLDFDHFSVMDIPVPLVMFRLHGLGYIVSHCFYLIGSRWYEKFPVQGGNRAYINPPTEIPPPPQHEAGESKKAFDARSKEYRLKIRALKPLNDAAWEANDWMLAKGRITWISTQGTRSRTGTMIEAPEGASKAWREADYVIPIALEGTFEMMPPGARLWYLITHLRQPIKVIVGAPLRTYQIAEIDGVRKTSRLKVRQVRLTIACLHYHLGDKKIAGVYLEEIEAEERTKSRASVAA